MGFKKDDIVRLVRPKGVKYYGSDPFITLEVSMDKYQPQLSGKLLKKLS